MSLMPEYERQRRYFRTPLGRENLRRFGMSPKGHEVSHKYRQGAKRREVQVRYDTSPKGREAQRRYRTGKGSQTNKLYRETHRAEQSAYNAWYYLNITKMKNSR